MAAEWRASTWGEEISLEYGKALRDHGSGHGRYRVFGSNGPIGWTSGTGCLLVRLGQRFPSPLFVSLALDNANTRAWIVQHAIGATMPNLNTTILSGVPIIEPSKPVLTAFNTIARPLEDRIVAGNVQISCLAALRDTLLPKLISGELRVEDAEKFIERAA